ncbi:MAG: hypothetical protein U0984_11515 [Prosthecobacter sp.]|nr:hypothetical protein [Prosthecobacter sp.]
MRARLAMIALLGGATFVHAAPPVLEALFPAGGQVGSTFTLAANGKLEADARLWTDCPGVFFVPNGKKREWQVTILAEAPPGLHLVRAWNAEGASEPRWFSVGSLPEMAEVEPNNEVGKGQALEKLPVCVNARLDTGGDVDGYTIKLAAGQTLVAVAEAYALGSAVDMVAHVVNDKGVRVLTVSDGRNLDPVVVFKAPAAGSYTVQLAGFGHPPVADVRFTGSTVVVYRMHLSAGPVVTELFPAVISTLGKTEVELRGYGLDPKKLRHGLPVMPTNAVGDVVALAVPNALQPVQVIAADKPGLMEKEPNQEVAQATPMKVGDSIGGHIADKDAMDRYALTVKKGDRVSLRLFARRIGSPLDAVLEVFNAEGKSLVSVDDVGDNSDPESVWTAPADGVFQVVVRDRFGHGGEAFAYVLQAVAPAAEFSVKLADGKALVLEAGKTVSLKATVKITGDAKTPLVCRMAQLPPGVFAAEVAVPEKGGEVEVKLQAAIEAPDFQGPIGLTVWTKAEPNHFKEGRYPLRGENLRGTSLLDEAEPLWLTVKGK